ncbi:hypothetical protein BV898_03540 [Hypsibius exemplaris]|uniref:Uncharacterized protein n=1 Tax=Hypsibius exemplaris TaxID=2072580 RepID=A0A1W0X5V0_HYPEX|nr:hypothetical protein BV898_03540 [Hypsibius exemplaris]
MLPWWIMDTAYFRKSINEDEGSCVENDAAQFVYMISFQVATSFIRNAVVIAVIPVVYCALRTEISRVAAIYRSAAPTFTDGSSATHNNNENNAPPPSPLATPRRAASRQPLSGIFLLEPGRDPILFMLSVSNLRDTVCRL